MNAFAYLLLCLIWGTTWLGIKITVQGLPPFLGASLRFVVASVILFVILCLWKIPLKIRKKDAGVLVLSAFFLYVFDYGLIYWAETVVSAGVAAVFFTPFGIFTVLWTHFLIRNKPFRPNELVGLVLGCLGMVILFYDQLMVTRFDRRVILAAAALSLGAAGGSLSLVLVKKHLTKMNPLLLTFHQSWMGVLFLAAIGMILESDHSLRITGRVGIAILYLGILGTSLAFVLYYRLLQTLSALTLALIPYITPIVALAADYLVFKETPTLRAAIGIVVIFLGIGLTQMKPGKLGPDGFSHG